MDERRSNGGGEGPGTPERPLGRGLEDVSHLFLTHSDTPAPGGRSGMGPPSADRDHRPRVNGVTPLHRMEPVTRQQLAAMLRDRNVGLEEGLTLLDEVVQCPPCGDIDVLAVDRAGQLTVVDFDVVLNDDLLLRGLGHIDWIVRNLPNVRRMFAGRAINFAAIPRLMLLAPRFSETLTRVALSMGYAQVECVKYHVVHMPGGAGIFFERVEPS